MRCAGGLAGDGAVRQPVAAKRSSASCGVRTVRAGSPRAATVAWKPRRSATCSSGADTERLMASRDPAVRRSRRRRRAPGACAARSHRRRVGRRTPCEPGGTPPYGRPAEPKRDPLSPPPSGPRRPGRRSRWVPARNAGAGRRPAAPSPTPGRPSDPPRHPTCAPFDSARQLTQQRLEGPTAGSRTAAKLAAADRASGARVVGCQYPGRPISWPRPLVAVRPCCAALSRTPASLVDRRSTS